jgi:hypothetical protein
MTNAQAWALDHFQKTLGAPFDMLLSCDDALCEKPDPRYFAYARGRYEGPGASGRRQPACRAEPVSRHRRREAARPQATCWIERRHGMKDSGGTIESERTEPDYHFRTLAELADAVDAGRMSRGRAEAVRRTALNPMATLVRRCRPCCRAWWRCAATCMPTRARVRRAPHRPVVAAALRLLGLEVTRGSAAPAWSDPCAAAAASRSVGLRADMDALPMQELGRSAHASRVAGVHHGCGHDGHTSMLIGAARQLARTRRFDGVVHFIFQPAEEGRAGARAMLEAGLLERFPCDALYALHNWPDLPLGTAQTAPGAIMAAADRFDITLRGRGGHAAQPQHTPDAILAASQLVAHLNTIVARRIDPAESAVSVGDPHRRRAQPQRAAGGSVADRHGAHLRSRRRRIASRPRLRAAAEASHSAMA